MSGSSNHDSGFEKAVVAAGGQSALGRLINRPQQTIHDRLRSGKPLWAEDVLTVEAATGVPKEILRPDIYPPEEGPPPPFAAELHRTDDPAPGPAATTRGANEVILSGKPLRSPVDADNYDGAHA